MKQAFAVEVVIERPIETVWQAMTDWERAGRWMKGIERLEPQGPVEVGTTLAFHARGQVRRAEVTGWTPERTLVLCSRQGGVVAEYAYELEALADGRTRVSLTAGCAASGPWALVGPILRWLIARTDGGQLAALKAWVEAD